MRKFFLITLITVMLLLTCTMFLHAEVVVKEFLGYQYIDTDKAECLGAFLAESVNLTIKGTIVQNVIGVTPFDIWMVEGDTVHFFMTVQPKVFPLGMPDLDVVFQNGATVTASIKPHSVVGSEGVIAYTFHIPIAQIKEIGGGNYYIQVNYKNEIYLSWPFTVIEF